MTAKPRRPSICVLSSLFPSQIQPNAGPFIRERMFRVAQALPLSVVSPTPWFPMQSLIRLRHPNFRPGAPAYECQSGIDVWYPRFFSVPGLLKTQDPSFMARAALPRLRALQGAGRLDLLDAHFGYPDGVAASRLARHLGVPFTVTLRGSEFVYSTKEPYRKRMAAALQRANHVIGVSEALCQLALSLNVPHDRVTAIPNGVDSTKFHRVDREAARSHYDIPPNAPTIVSVGRLVEGKGIHRVLDCLPEMIKSFPSLVYLIVGEESGPEQFKRVLQCQVKTLHLETHVRFLGSLPQSHLKVPLSAADLFVLATRREGWANVFLEAMSCGLPVITTDVYGNAEVVCRPDLGLLVPFGDQRALQAAIEQGLRREWDRNAIIEYAKANDWSSRIRQLQVVFESMF
ncbi:glycosyl transferase group 1 [Thiorhodococcus drewsii AZ1]|uniref:Glycosyl transferase group 1 n=1 Tax=Thiorhodococcus drewsii AZ1 TaxID=765913 RepID=G2E7X5_9GAMM|nr:glycosyltransferase [Thiorhodococcus drewsii]EGV27815.1 glycosyl transferase group 1 [Thiorhodococcus drewsii AZ1]